MRYPWRQGRGKRAVGVGVPGDVDGTPREAGADPPVTGPVCAGGGVAGNPAADAHATRLSGPGARAGPDVARAAPVGGPGKGRAPVPVRAAERPCVPVTAVSGDATAGHVPREMSHDPGEDRAAGIHRVLLPAVAVQGGSVGAGDAGSGRQHRKSPINVFSSEGYGMLIRSSWGSSELHPLLTCRRPSCKNSFIGPRRALTLCTHSKQEIHHEHLQFPLHGGTKK